MSQYRIKRLRWRCAPLVIISFGFICFLRISGSIHGVTHESSYSAGQLSDMVPSRQLLSFEATEAKNNTPKCVPQAITNFPLDPFTNDQRKHGFILLHVAVALYMFLGLAIVCDDYFVPSLECICEFMNLQPDVAGATFMAAGSSAPEMATTVIGVFIAKDDIGLGAVVGSADYNLMFVISVCALFARSVIHLNWWPLVRDCAVYSISVIALAIVIYDGKVYWYESVVLLLLYLLYVTIMYFNPRLESFFLDKCAGCLPVPKNSPTNKYLLRDNSNDRDLELAVPLTTTINGSCLEEIALEEVHRNEGAGGSASTNGAYRTIPSDKHDASNEAIDLPENGLTSGESSKRDSSETPDWAIAWPSDSSRFTQFIHVIGFPLKLLLFLTVPDCRRPRCKRLFWITFIMCCIWISAYSYLMVWMITVIGHTAGIPDTVMGLTFIAAGSSVPDAIASVLVVREGEGDMAVSNAVGSNIFDILVCMGFPWLLKAIITVKAVTVYSAGLFYSTFTLLGTVVLLLGATHLNGWKLNKKYGVLLMVVYIAFLAVCCLYETNVFGVVNAPPCEFID